MAYSKKKFVDYENLRTYTEQVKDYISSYVNENKGDNNVQGNWNENDPTSDAYIQNRTHYASEGVEKFNGTWIASSHTDDDKEMDFSFLGEWTEGTGYKTEGFTTYTVILDGVIYNNLSVNFYSGTYNTWTLGDNSESLPFKIEFSNYEYSLFETPTESSDVENTVEHTIVILDESGETVHKLDAKYLPAATTESFGAVKVGTGLSVSDGVISADIPTVPTSVSSFTNDAGYLTAHQDISGKVNSADLATVATSGSYEDLEDKPFGEESLVFSKTLRPAVFTGNDNSGISPVVVTDLVTDGTFVPFVEGNTYDVSYDETLYENLTIQPRPIKYKGQEEEDPEVYLVLGNRDGLFLRSNIVTMLSDETRALLEDSDIPFMMMHYDGSQDDRLAFAFFSNSYDHTLSVYEHGTDNLLYTVVLSNNELSLTNTPLLYCGTGTKALEDFHFEIGQTLRVKVNGQNCEGVWRVPEGSEGTGAMEALIYPEGYVAPESSGSGDDLVVDNPYSGTEVVLMLSTDESTLGDMFAIGNPAAPTVEKAFEMNYTVIKMIDPQYIPVMTNTEIDALISNS